MRGGLFAHAVERLIQLGIDGGQSSVLAQRVLLAVGLGLIYGAAGAADFVAGAEPGICPGSVCAGAGAFSITPPAYDAGRLARPVDW